MKLLKFSLLACLLSVMITPKTDAQQGNFPPGAIPFSGVPTGSCSANQIAVNTTNGNLYSCSASAWVASGGGALALPSVDTSGLIGEYLMVDGSTTKYVDSSTAKNDGTFASGGCTVAPTSLAGPSFGYSYLAASTQCGSFPAAVNAARTIMIAVNALSGNQTAAGCYPLLGSTASNYNGINFIVGNNT